MALLHGTEILLIEDTIEVAASLRRLLESSGASVAEARTAQSALVEAERLFPHLIICDLGLAGAGGVRFIVDLKKSAALSRIPVLLLSSGIDKTGILRAVSMGAVDCMVKPFHPLALIQRAERLIQANRLKAHEFAPERRTSVSLSVPMEVTRVGEGGFTVEAPVMLGPEASVRLECGLLEQLNCAELVTRSTGEMPVSVGEQLYSNEINLLGVGPKQTKTIRKFLRSGETGGGIE